MFSTCSRYPTSLLPVILGLVFMWSSAAAQETVGVFDGFELHRSIDFAPNNVGFGGLTFTLDGDVVVHESGEIVRIDEEDTRTLLASFAPEIFGSFVVLTPAGDKVIFGESTNGGLFEIALDGGGSTHVDTVSFNYDMVFDGEARGFISSPAPDFVGNRIFLFDSCPETPNPSVVIDIPGFSGPVTVDDQGRLYYGTAEFSDDTSFQKIVRFSKAQVDTAVAGVPVSYDDGEVILSELDSISDMLFVGNRLFYSDLGFSAGEGRIWMLDADQNFAETIFARFTASEVLVSPGHLAFHAGEISFEVGVGPDGGRLAMAYSDFSTINRVGIFVPQQYFVRGEVNGDGFVNVSDAIAILIYLFIGGFTPASPLARVDINDSGMANSTDVIVLLEHLFLGGPPPAAPYPEPGVDATP